MNDTTLKHPETSGLKAQYRLWPVMGLLLITLAGCGGGMSDLQSYIEEVKSRKTNDVEPIPQIKPYESFTYIAEGRRDPFAPAPTLEGPNGGNANSGIQPDTKRNKEPLEEFPLDALRMVGTLSIKGQQFALVRAPDAIVHRVSTGNYMGQNYGKIISISESEITLREIVPDGFGGYQEQPASIAMSEK